MNDKDYENPLRMMKVILIVVNMVVDVVIMSLEEVGEVA